MSELSSVRYVSIRSAAERVSETTTVPSATSSPMNAVAKITDDDGHREPARQLEPLEIAHERIERERDHGGGQEEEEDVPERPREEEGEEQQDRQPDELDPPWDPDRRRAGAHLAHAAIVALSPLGDEDAFPACATVLPDGLAALPASRSSP